MFSPCVPNAGLRPVARVEMCLHCVHKSDAQETDEVSTVCVCGRTGNRTKLCSCFCELRLTKFHVRWEGTANDILHFRPTDAVASRYYFLGSQLPLRSPGSLWKEEEYSLDCEMGEDHRK